MIPKAQITRRAVHEGVSGRTVERDYIIAHVVTAMAQADESRIVFKGGTALRLCFFDQFRYSADLDFSLVEIRLDEAYEAIKDALSAARETIGLARLELDERTPPRIAFVGPLGRPRWIKLDLADDELVLHRQRSELRTLWPDVPPGVEITSYPLLEIAGEKLRCVLQRLQCRDLFDLHELFDRAGVDVDEAAAVFRAKAEHRGFDPTTFSARFEQRLPEYGRRWHDELSEHLGAAVPEFDGIKRRVIRHLRRAGLL